MMDKETFKEHYLNMKRYKFNENFAMIILTGVVIFLVVIIFNVAMYVDKFMANKRSDAEGLLNLIFSIFGTFALIFGIIIIFLINFVVRQCCCKHKQS